MSRQQKQFHIFKFAGRVLFLLCISLIPLCSQAQEPDDTTATVSVSPVEVVDSTGETVIDEVVRDETDPVNYFSERNYAEDNRKFPGRQVTPGTVQTEKKDKSFWYADLSPDGKRPAEEEDRININPPRKSITDETWFQTILWFIIIGGFATCIGIYLSSNNIGIFRRKNISLAGAEAEGITEDIFAINYQQEIDKACAAGNYRLAVRLQFLRMLKKMSERQVIRYTVDKTNFDYLMQLQGGKYYEDFFRITRDYEYSWYGQFPVTEEMYNLIRQDFDKMGNELTKY